MKKLSNKILLLVLLMCLSFGLFSCGKPNDEPEDFDFTDLSVRDYKSENGIVTAANPYAAKVGIDILKAGGNAFDAAVAVSFALGVVEMDATGLGGGGLMIAYNVNTKKSLYYNFREFASSTVSTNLADYPNSKDIGERYAVYTAVPTQLAGLNEILTNEGTMTLQQILAPSIALAKEGVVATPELINNINENTSRINRNEYLKSTFKNENGGRKKIGDLIIQTDLANTLEAISNNGIGYFYEGEFAEKLVKTVTDNGGYMCLDDLTKAYKNRTYLMEDSIIEGTYKDYQLMTVGTPSTGGTMLIEMLNMVEGYESNTNKSIKDLKQNSAEYLNLLATILQLSYGDKEKYLADTNFVETPLTGLLSKEYAKERITKYQEGKAYLGTALNSTEVPYGNPYPYNNNNKAVAEYELGCQDSHYSTTSFSIIDKDGNMVTITQTINNFFGCGVSPEGSGFFLNDQMKDFSYVEGSINCIAPGKQPASYMLPTVVLKNGNPYATFGTPGGSRIPSAALQVFLNMVEFDMDIQQAIASPRIYCFTTNEDNRSDTAKLLYIENGLVSLKDELTNMGYNVKPYGEDVINSYFGGVQGIKVEEYGYHGGADPRRDGKALGF